MLIFIKRLSVDEYMGTVKATAWSVHRNDRSAGVDAAGASRQHQKPSLAEKGTALISQDAQSFVRISRTCVIPFQNKVLRNLRL